MFVEAEAPAKHQLFTINSTCVFRDLRAVLMPPINFLADINRGKEDIMVTVSIWEWEWRRRRREEGSSSWFHGENQLRMTKILGIQI
jgi:hypothetical protein